jgi:hypothetical protein
MRDTGEMPMQPLKDFIASLTQSGVELWLNEEELRFRAPKGAFGPEERERVQLRKEEIVAYLRDRQQTNAAADGERLLPLSYAEQAFVGYYDLADDPCVQHVSYSVRLLGALNLPALQSAVKALGARHGALRTRYVRTPESLHAVVDDEISIALELISIPESSDISQDTQVREAFAAFLRRRFDLDHGPLMRTCVIRVAPDHHVLAMVVHHCISDGWSRDILSSELAALYEAFAADRAPALPPPAIEYADHSRWLRSWVDSDTGRLQLAYWTRRLAGVREPYWLPRDAFPHSEDASRGVPCGGSISSAHTARLRKLAERERTTLFVMAMAALSSALGKWSTREEVLMAVIHAGRQRAELHNVVGCFVEAWVLRVSLSEASTFLEMAHRVNAAYVQALPYLQVPYWKVKEELARLAGEATLLDITVNYVPRTGGWPAPGTGGLNGSHRLRAEAVELREPPAALHPSSGCKLFVTFLEAGDGSLRWTLEYAVDQFSSTAVAAAATHIGELLREAAV